MESQTSYPNIMKVSKTLNRHYYDQQSRRVNDYLSKQRVIHCSNAEADNSLLNDALLQGFNPKWYIVLRMHEPNTPKVYTRRKDIDSITKDLRVLKGELYRGLVGLRKGKEPEVFGELNIKRILIIPISIYLLSHFLILLILMSRH